MDAEKHKAEGNAQFKLKKYERAIKSYKKAIELQPNNEVYQYNLGQAHKELKEWEEALRAAQTALTLNPKYIKAILLRGKCCVEMGKAVPDTATIDKGILDIRKAITLCPSQKKREFERDLTRSLRNALKIRWYKEYELLTAEAMVLVNELTGLMNAQVNISIEERAKNIRRMQKLLIPKKKRKSAVPEYLLCDLTGELMEMPVTTSQGYTYEKAKLEAYFAQQGNSDPVTKTPIDPMQVCPNYNIKAATEEFLEREPWAFEYNGDYDYRHITL